MESSHFSPMKLFPITVSVALWLFALPAWPLSGAEKSAWVGEEAGGKLTYKALPAGDRIMDFSWAGYGGGGVALPVVPVKKTVRPSGGDDTAMLQAALEEVGSLPAVNGLRGAVLMEAGRYQCSATLQMKTSGVVLRGSGSAAGGTVLELIDKPHAAIAISGSGGHQPVGEAVPVTDEYVPSGAVSFHVRDASSFKSGETILIQRPATAAWVKFMGMDGLRRNGKEEHWVSGIIECERTVEAVAGNQITVSVPLADSLDARYLNPPGATVVKASGGAFTAQVGIENLRIVSPPQKVAIDAPHHSGVRVKAARDVWMKDLAIVDTVGSISFDGDSRCATVTGVSVEHNANTVGAAKPADFSADGGQILFDRCTGKGDNLFYFVTGARVTGPNVVLNCTFHGNGHVQPHQRWAAGLLVDGCKVPEGGIDFMNRGEMGSGHGWTMGWAVAWNCEAETFTIQQPPGATNWAIGCRGQRVLAAMPFGKEPKLPEGIYDSHGTPVQPVSLYLAQLRARLGAQAVKNIGY